MEPQGIEQKHRGIRDISSGWPSEAQTGEKEKLDFDELTKSAEQSQYVAIHA